MADEVNGFDSLRLPGLASFAIEVADVDQLDELSSEERACLPDLVSPKRLREFRAGRHVARRALEQLGMSGVTVAADQRGVPRFPAGVRGSISHTGRERTLAVAAVCSSPGFLGVDVELRRELSMPLFERIASPEERTRFGDHPEGALLVFSAKESAYKAIYPRLRKPLGFHDVKLTWQADRSLRAHIDELAVELDVHWSRTDRYVMTLALSE